MHVTINELRKINHPGDGPGYMRVYLNVTAREGGKKVTEEFHIGRKVVSQPVIRRASDGWLLSTDGDYYDPEELITGVEHEWQREHYEMDFSAEIRDVMRKTFRNMFDGKHREDPVKDGLKQQVFTRFGNERQLPLNVRRLLNKAEEI